MAMFLDEKHHGQPHLPFPDSLIHSYNKKCFKDYNEAVYLLTNKVLHPGELAFAYYNDPNATYGVAAIAALGPLVHGRGNQIFKNADQIDALVDTVNKVLSEQDNNIVYIKSELFNELDELKYQLNSSMADLKKEVDSPLESYRLSVDSMNSSILSVTEKTMVLEVKIQDLYNELKETLSNTNNELGASIQNSELKILGNMALSIDNVKQALEVDIKKVNSDLIDLSININGKADRNYNELKSLTENHYNNSIKHTDDLHAQVDARLTSSVARLKADDTSIITNLSNMIYNTSTELQNYVDTTEKNTVLKLYNTSDAIVTYINTTKDLLNTSINKVNSSVNTYFNNSSANIHSKINDTSAKINDKINTNLNTAKSYTDTKVEDLSTKIYKYVDDASNALKKYTDDREITVRKSVLDLSTDLNTKHTNNNQLILNLSTNVYKKIADTSKDLNTYITNVSSYLMETRSAFMASSSTYFASVSKNLLDTLTAKVDDASRMFVNYCTLTDASIAQTVKDHRDDVSIKMNSHFLDTSANMARIKSELMIDYTSKITTLLILIHDLSEQIINLDCRIRNLERLGVNTEGISTEGFANIILLFIDVNKNLNDLLLLLNIPGQSKGQIFIPLGQHISENTIYGDNHFSTLRLDEFNKVLKRSNNDDYIEISLYNLTSAGLNSLNFDLSSLTLKDINNIFNNPEIANTYSYYSKISGYYIDDSNKALQFKIDYPNFESGKYDNLLISSGSLELIKLASKYNGNIKIEIVNK